MATLKKVTLEFSDLEKLVHFLVRNFRKEFEPYYYSKKCYLMMPKYALLKLLHDRDTRFGIETFKDVKQGEVELYDLPVFFNYEDAIVIMHEDALVEPTDRQPIMKIEGLLTGVSYFVSRN